MEKTAKIKKILKIKGQDQPGKIIKKQKKCRTDKGI
jgi:hypothetical protein